jgi:hypothetical protein
MKANQLRLWFASFAYVLLEALRRIGLRHTQLANATCGTIRLKLLKIGALVRISVRRIKIAMASACPHRPPRLPPAEARRLLSAQAYPDTHPYRVPASARPTIRARRCSPTLAPDRTRFCACPPPGTTPRFGV